MTLTRNFVVAFGGTGARCVEALTYLCASGYLSEPLHVLVVDPDMTNGNVDDTLRQLQRYHTLHNQLAPNIDASPLFSTRLNDRFKPTSFRWEYPSANQPFSTLIQYQQQPGPQQALLNLLYDEDDLKLSFGKGYWGKAHVGSLDLFRNLDHALKETAVATEESQESEHSLQVFFSGVRTAAQGDGARLAVCGSIFGGTGASGLPALPPLIRQNLREVTGGITIGCVQVAPYFSFPVGGSQDPDSAKHPLATQAALYHYAFNDVGYDAIYLVGAPDRAQTNDSNNPGGANQRNKAHYVELAAALALGDFFSSPPTTVKGGQVRACGASALSWYGFPQQESPRLRERLQLLSTLSMLHAHFLFDDLQAKRHRGSRWLAELERREARSLGGREEELRDLRDFALRFLNWADQIQATSESELFSIDSSPTSESLGTIGSGGQAGTDVYHELVSGLNRVEGLEQNTGVGWYVHGLSEAVAQFCTDHYGSWWKS